MPTTSIQIALAPEPYSLPRLLALGVLQETSGGIVLAGDIPTVFLHAEGARLELSLLDGELVGEFAPSREHEAILTLVAVALGFGTEGAQAALEWLRGRLSTMPAH